MDLDEAMAELRRCDVESKPESQEIRAVIANAVISGRLVPATALSEAQATIARLEAWAARQNEVIDNAISERTEELRSELSEADHTIARLEAALREAREWIDDWPDPRYGTKEEANWRDEVLAQIDAALSPREGEG